MSRATNNLALTFGQINFKIFVRESNELLTESSKKPSVELKFEGDEAKKAYEEIITQEQSTSSLKKQNTIPKESETVSTNSSKIKKKLTKTNDINTLFKAIELGDLDFVHHNFSKDNVNITDQFGWTPLMSASCAGHLDIVNFLIELGANKKVKVGYTAMDLALKKNHLHIVDALKQNLSKKRKKESTEQHICQEDKKEKEKHERFFCDTCKIYFSESSRNKHESSTLHVFNSGPKLKNTFYGISKQNKGYQMLLNTGWNEEGGLGPEGEGQKYPVKTVLKRDRKGIGLTKTDKNSARVTHFNPGDPNAVKSVFHKRKPFKRRDREKELSKEAAKTRALRRALS